MNNEEIIEEMQQVVAQMIIDDLEEDPSLENELFDCDCCGMTKMLAGSIDYNGYRLCNECVLIAETGFALNKIKDVQELINAAEDKNLKALCEFIKKQTNCENN